MGVPGGGVARAILCFLLAVFLFSSMNALVKSLGNHYPLAQIIFARALFAMLVLWPFIVRAGGLRSLRTKRPLGHLMRSCVGICAMSCSFYALTRLPLAHASALAFTAPLWTTLLGILFLGERVRWRRALALVAGFIGVIVMLNPDRAQALAMLSGTHQALGSLAALAGAALAAFAMIAVRRLSGTEPSSTIVFYFMLTGVMASGAWLLQGGFIMPDLHDAALLILLGLMGGFAQILLTMGYRGAPVAVIAPFDYTAMIWAAGYGFILWDEVPDLRIAIGAAIVIGSGVYITLREIKLGVGAVASAKAPASHE
jgi:drug/metabolite transporter (DMT)-like permease